MSTLYITDLDGTLLDKNARISQNSKEILQGLISRGAQFTVATARSPATVVDILSGIEITLPSVLMTGAIVYDIANKKTVKTTNLSQDSVRQICDLLEETGQNAMAYCANKTNMTVYHKEITSTLESCFMAPRKGTEYKTYEQIDNYHTALNGKTTIMFLICIQDAKKAAEYSELINNIDGVRCYFYQYEYDVPGFLLEVYDENCSKASSLDIFKEEYGIDKIIAFGDNINDLPLFEAADECYAVENAVEALKNAATDVIGKNTSDSVAKFIAEHFENEGKRS